MNKRINIILPETTVRVLDQVTTKGNRSQFIDRAVRHYVETQGRKNLREQLKAGYQANAERDLAIAATWFPLEEEAWQTFERSQRQPRRKIAPRKRA
jgi:metal-responsive CopG/Arc/MetJ family transcriptional regulator